MRQRLRLRHRLRLVGRLVVDVFAVLLFAMVTASLSMKVLDMRTSSGLAIAFPFLAGSTYFLVRGLQSLWLTVADLRSGSYLPAQPHHS